MADTSLFVKMFSGGESVSKQSRQQAETETLSEREGLLMMKKEFLNRKIDLELLFAKENCRKNRRVALQALRRKKWYEKHIKYIDCAVKALRSAHEHIDILNKVNKLIGDINEEQNLTEDIAGNLCTSVSFGLEFDEDKLTMELEKLENSVDETQEDMDKPEEGGACGLNVLSTESPSIPAKTKEEEEEEVEVALKYLQRWANEPI